MKAKFCREINESEIPEKVKRALVSNGFLTLDDVQKYLDITWIKYMPGVGPKQCKQTLNVLQDYGIELPKRRYRSYFGLTLQECKNDCRFNNELSEFDNFARDLLKLHVMDVCKSLEEGESLSEKDLKIMRNLIDQELFVRYTQKSTSNEDAI